MHKYVPLVALFVVFVVVVILMGCRRGYFDNFINAGGSGGSKKDMVFKAPASLSVLTNVPSKTLAQPDITGTGSLLTRSADALKKVIASDTSVVDSVNIIQVPSFFNANEKWPGCLPRPLYQGTCGSCWGFAAVTCLSARFFIESCSNSSCGTYPQVNSGSIDDVYANINYGYGFNKIYLKNISDYVDINKDGEISRSEWLDSVKQLQSKLWKLPKHSRDRYYIAQLLVQILDFQGSGSISLKDIPSVTTRAQKTFDIWSYELGGTGGKSGTDGTGGTKEGSLTSAKLLEYWRKQPLNLSAEKLITCCTNCYKLEFKGTFKNSENPACSGGSLKDAWVLLRDTGTVETLCIGYGLDNYEEGDELLSCRELQGPFYSFCSGYRFKDIDKYNESETDINKELNDLENSGAYPVAIYEDSKNPWVDPQLIRFKAKNAYTVSPKMAEIQREIIQRGPVNSGFYVYDDFQNRFGGIGKGGQLYDGSNGSNPLGGFSNSLIYMRDPELKGEPTGGHAISLVGWGTFAYKDYLIPYWTCLNSWGIDWGHSGFSTHLNRNNVPKNMKSGGYFWIVRGINNCGIEENVVCGQPNIENMSYPNVVTRYGWGAESPSTTNPNIKFLPPLDTGDISINNKKLVISPTLPGGGGFVTYVPPSTYDIKSMLSPSPFVMFWPVERPTYCIGKTLNALSPTDTVIRINQKCHDFLSIVRKNIYKNPLLIIGHDSVKDGGSGGSKTDGDGVEDIYQEQVQLLKLEPDKITVSRGVNYNSPLTHVVGSYIKIFPYQNMSMDFLDKNKFPLCASKT